MSNGSDEKQEKTRVITRLLEDEYLLVHLDPSDPNVVIPENLKDKPTVTLKLSRLFRGGLELKDEVILTTLLFGQKYIDCRIPLSAIWGVTGRDNSNIIWPESTPKSVLKELILPAAAQESNQTNESNSKTNKKSSKLRRVK